MSALVKQAFNATVGNAYLLLTLTALLWGGNAVAGRLAAFEWQPFTVTSLRWLLATIYLFPFAIGPLRRDWPLIRRHLLLLLSLGAFGMALFNLFMFLALNHTTAINVAIEQASVPMLIMLANFVFLRQRVRGLQIVGLLLTLVGVLLTATAGQVGRFLADGLNRGDALMLIACLFYAGYSFGLRWRPNIHWMGFMWLISASAFVMTIPFAGWELSRVGFSMPGINGWLVLLYVIIFPTLVAQLAFARGVELIGSNRAGLFVNLVPIFGSLLAVLILGEQFRWYHLAGMTLVLAGIALAEKVADKTRPA